MMKRKRNKHHIAGIILILILVAIAVLLVFNVEKASLHNHYWQLYRSPPIEPLTPAQLKARETHSIQPLDVLLKKHFQRELNNDAGASAWLVQVKIVNTGAEAEKMLAQVQGLGLDSFVLPVVQGDQTTFQLIAGPFVEQSEAQDAINLLHQRLKVTGVLEQYSISAQE